MIDIKFFVTFFSALIALEIVSRMYTHIGNSLYMQVGELAVCLGGLFYIMYKLGLLGFLKIDKREKEAKDL